MEQSKRVAKNTAILYAKMAITIFLSLYTTRLVLVGLGVKDFGTFNLVGGIITMLGFLNTAMATATQRFMSFTQGEGDFMKLKQIFNVSLLLHIIIAILLLIIFEIAGYFFFNSILNIPPNRIYAAKMVYQLMVVSTLFTVIAVPYDAVINAHENMLLYAILGIIESVLKLLLALFLIQITSDRLVFYGLFMGLITLLLLVSRAIYCNRKYAECKIEIRKNYDNRLFNELKNFAGWTFLGSSTSMIAFYGQGIVINVFFGTAVNAAQGLANQISGQLGAFSTTMLRALNPLIDKSEGSGNRGVMLETSMLGSKISFFLLMILIIPVLTEMEFVLSFWLRDVPPFAIIFCELLLLKNLIEQLCLPIISSITAVGNIKGFQIYASIISIFPLLITYFLYSSGYPPYVLYYVFIFYSIVSSANILYFANRTCGLSYKIFFSEVVFKCLLCFSITIILSAIPKFVMQESFLRLILVTIISLTSFTITIWKFGLKKTERTGIQVIIYQLRMKFLPGPKKTPPLKNTILK